MSIYTKLSSLTIKPFAKKIGGHLITDTGVKIIEDLIINLFTDNSMRINNALKSAQNKGWKALEIALAGDSFWEKCKIHASSGDEKALGQQVRVFLDSVPLPVLKNNSDFRKKCLEELRAVRKNNSVFNDNLDINDLARQTAQLSRFGDSTILVENEFQILLDMGTTLNEHGYSSLAWLITQKQDGIPILILATRYFFRRSIEDDQKLFNGLAISKLDILNENQEKCLSGIYDLISKNSDLLSSLLSDVRSTVVETKNAVLDLHDQIEGQGEQIKEISKAVMELLEQHQLQKRPIQPMDSLSIRNDSERIFIKQLIARYRILPENERAQVPALLNAIGKLEVVNGDFDAAQKDFQTVALIEKNNIKKSQAHFNSYQTSLEQRKYDSAIDEFIKAVKLNPKEYAPFPVGKYHPLAILGSGGFGTAFLCRHKYMNSKFVVKTLHLDALGTEPDKVFAEAQILRQLDHPAIIRISECGYVDGAKKTHPHIIMDYFHGDTFESFVNKNGTFSPNDMLIIGKLVAEGLQAAHNANILHRDIKPANLLIVKENNIWKVKIIDFGLAMPQKIIEKSYKGTTSIQKNTIIGNSIAGTLDYAAPEQMGKRNAPIGPHSDIYGWAKTCCYCMFKTPQPLLKHWNTLPILFADLLEKCLDEDHEKRPSDFNTVLNVLNLSINESFFQNKKESEFININSMDHKNNFISKTYLKIYPYKKIIIIGSFFIITLSLCISFYYISTNNNKDNLFSNSAKPSTNKNEIQNNTMTEKEKKDIFPNESKTKKNIKEK